MKNTVRILMALSIMLLVFVSCKREEGPETVAKKFANHYVAGEYQQAAIYGTESTRELLNMMESLASVGYHHEDGNIPNEYTEEDIDCVISEDGNTAVCNYWYIGELEEIKLSYIDGKWLVDISLDDQYYEDENWYEEQNEDWKYDGSEAQLN